MRERFIKVNILIYVLILTTACNSKKTEYITYDNSEEVRVDITEDLDYTKAVVENICVSENVTVTVYVCGAVLSPGVYHFDEGDIKDSAIKAAGGFTDDAVKDYVNLAEKLRDGERIYVPCKSELETGIVSYLDDEAGTIAGNVDSDGRVNINTAGKDELMTLAGIGESKAELIISYRTENGSFKSTEDLMKINGIKEGVYSKIKDKITVN